ncbi:hypothetical protein EIN_150040 [Entamoeba invadens IP1]|uniref:Uncharacterized protein n=1 Tax=Entamoeba invadens IP1 TaxID=370355 RepID=A0A0A1U8K4_ENTIV|nr:hypothetical protein EIN_150040 [Entamoeba invadens IP1]ELP91177.1 hypothetical protein EIN_150040 [Entamoeba invadens IP1]|eukprot:XP_004257948.1 hypothetical protein EIN_150040 [Entamoeba invadens IP1]
MERVSSSTIFQKKYFVERFNVFYDENKAKEDKRKRLKRKTKEQGINGVTPAIQTEVPHSIHLKEKENKQYSQFRVLTDVPEILLQFCDVISDFVQQLDDEDNQHISNYEYSHKRLNRLIKVYNIATNMTSTENFNFTVDQLYGDMTVKDMVFGLINLGLKIKDEMVVTQSLRKNIAKFLEGVAYLIAFYDMTAEMIEFVIYFAHLLVCDTNIKMITIGGNIVFSYVQGLKAAGKITQFLNDVNISSTILFEYSADVLLNLMNNVCADEMFEVLYIVSYEFKSNFKDTVFNMGFKINSIDNKNQFKTVLSDVEKDLQTSTKLDWKRKLFSVAKSARNSYYGLICNNFDDDDDDDYDDDLKENIPEKYVIVDELY